MPATALACAWALLASAGASLGYDLGLRGDARYRTLTLPRALPSESVEAELSAAAGLRIAGHAAQLTLSYEPRLTVSDRRGDSSIYLHRGVLAATWQPDPLWTLTASGRAAWGDLSFLELLTLPSQPGVPLEVAQSVPAVRTLPYERLQGGLGLEWRPAPRWTTRLSGEVFREGGRTSEARVYVPNQLGTRALGAVEWQVAPRSFLSGSLQGVRGDFARNAGPDVWGVHLLTAWRQLLDQNSSLRLAAGVARNSASPGFEPAGEAALDVSSRLLGSQLDLRLEASLAPMVDRLTATVAQRLAAGVALSWRLTREWRVEAAGSMGRTIQGSHEGSTLFTGELRGSHRFDEWLEIGLALRGLRQVTMPADELLLDRAVFLWVGIQDRGWLWR